MRTPGRGWSGAALMAVVLVASACGGGSDDAPLASATAAPTSTVTPGGAATGKARPLVIRTGVLVRDNPGMPPGRWFLVYEEPGAPALTFELAITTSTRCLDDTKVARCDALLPGTRVRVEGAEVAGRLDVTTLEVLEAPLSAP